MLCLGVVLVLTNLAFGLKLHSQDIPENPAIFAQEQIARFGIDCLQLRSIPGHAPGPMEQAILCDRANKLSIIRPTEVWDLFQKPSVSMPGHSILYLVLHLSSPTVMQALQLSPFTLFSPDKSYSYAIDLLIDCNSLTSRFPEITSLMIAVVCNRIDLLQSYFDQGGYSDEDVDRTEPAGRTALDFAYLLQNNEAKEILLAHGAACNPEVKTLGDSSPSSEGLNGWFPDVVSEEDSDFSFHLDPSFDDQSLGGVSASSGEHDFGDVLFHNHNSPVTVNHATAESLRHELVGKLFINCDALVSRLNPAQGLPIVSNNEIAVLCDRADAIELYSPLDVWELVGKKSASFPQHSVMFLALTLNSPDILASLQLDPFTLFNKQKAPAYANELFINCARSTSIVEQVTPAMIAVVCGHTDVLEDMVSPPYSSEDLNILHKRDNLGRTALDFAYLVENIEAQDILEELKAPCNEELRVLALTFSSPPEADGSFPEYLSDEEEVESNFQYDPSDEEDSENLDPNTSRN